MRRGSVQINRQPVQLLYISVGNLRCDFWLIVRDCERNHSAFLVFFNVGKTGELLAGFKVGTFPVTGTEVESIDQAILN